MTEKKPISDRLKKVRSDNMAKARKVRMQNIRKKKEKEENDLSSEEDRSSGDESEDFVISKKKAVKKSTKESRKEVLPRSNKEIEDLREMVMELAKLHKRQSRHRSDYPKAPKIYNVIPTQNPAPYQQPKPSNQSMDALMNALMK